MVPFLTTPPNRTTAASTCHSHHHYPPSHDTHNIFTYTPQASQLSSYAIGCVSVDHFQCRIFGLMYILITAPTRVLKITDIRSRNRHSHKITHATYSQHCQKWWLTTLAQPFASAASVSAILCCGRGVRVLFILKTLIFLSISAVSSHPNGIYIYC